MKKLIKILSIITFLLATATIASIAYEGMMLKWFSFVRYLILTTDILFLITTIIGIFYYKSDKNLFISHILSIFVILIGIIMTLIFGKDMPKMLFLLWEFYILYFYGIMVIKNV